MTAEIISCASDPCQNGATCSELSNGEGHICICVPGFEGVTCSSGNLIVLFLIILS